MKWLYEWWSKLRDIAVPRGVRRYRSLEEANADRYAFQGDPVRMASR